MATAAISKTISAKSFILQRRSSATRFVVFCVSLISVCSGQAAEPKFVDHSLFIAP